MSRKISSIDVGNLRSVSERIRAIRVNSGLNQYQFGKSIGIAANSVSDLETGKKEPTETILIAIEYRYSINPGWILTGEGEMTIPSAVQNSICTDEFDFVPEFHQDIAAGHGAFVLSQEVKNQYAFRKEWISKYCSKNRCALFTAKGDSMLPLIGNGDKILVDMSKKEMSDIIDGKIYVFSEGDLLKVKRLVRKGSGLLAISDNKAEIPDPVEVDMLQFRLVGKVIWVGHVVK